MPSPTWTDLRRGGGLLAAAGLLALAALASLAFGNLGLPLSEVWHALTEPGDSYAHAVVDSRVPRTLLGVLAGASLAVAGVLIQGVTRNPLGDPGLLGVNAGAAAAIVTGAAFLDLGTSNVWIALPGSLLAVTAVYLLGTSGRGVTPVRLVLAGAVVSAVLVAYIEGVALTHPDAFDRYRFWVVGSLAGRDLDVVREIAPFVAVGLVAAAALVPGLNVLAVGDETAQALGARVSLLRGGGAAAATLLSAAATAACGPIAFIVLAVPHLLRPFTGADLRWLLPYSALLGPVLLLGADIVGRIVIRPAELMAGVVVSFLGAPMLMLTVRRLRGQA